MTPKAHWIAIALLSMGLALPLHTITPFDSTEEKITAANAAYSNAFNKLATLASKVQEAENILLTKYPKATNLVSEKEPYGTANLITQIQNRIKNIYGVSNKNAPANPNDKTNIQTPNVFVLVYKGTKYTYTYADVPAQYYTSEEQYKTKLFYAKTEIDSFSNKIQETFGTPEDLPNDGPTASTWARINSQAQSGRLAVADQPSPGRIVFDSLTLTLIAVHEADLAARSLGPLSSSITGTSSPYATGSLLLSMKIKFILFPGVAVTTLYNPDGSSTIAPNANPYWFKYDNPSMTPEIDQYYYDPAKTPQPTNDQLNAITTFINATNATVGQQSDPATSDTTWGYINRLKQQSKTPS